MGRLWELGVSYKDCSLYLCIEVVIVIMRVSFCYGGTFREHHSKCECDSAYDNRRAMCGMPIHRWIALLVPTLAK